MLVSTTILGPAAAEAHPADEITTAAVKAAFIYNFAKFTSWPAGRLQSPSEPIHLCVQGGDLDRRALSPLEKKRIGERQVRIEVLLAGASIEGCHIFFASGFASEPALREALNVAQRHGVLMVSDLPDFAALGGHIGLVQDRNRLRFQVNLNSVVQTDLRLSSKLLHLAEIVGPARK